MGRSKHTSSQEYAAMGRNLAYSWRGIKKTKGFDAVSENFSKIIEKV
jgi:hypothetical protein